MAEKKEKQYVSDNARLMAEWNWDKNNELELYPHSLTLGSGKKVWWKCAKGHEWDARIEHRTKGSDCPYCSGRYAVKGVNDLATLNPSLTKEWNYEKNRDFKPEDFTVSSGKKVWWKCQKTHEWKATVASRNSGTGCPICSNKQILIGYNDLATVNPTLASEWNHQKNGKLKPENFTVNSGIKVWWKCSKGHEWQSTIDKRSNGRNCPYCSNHKVLQGYNDLATVNPILAKEWNYEKNNGLKPVEIAPNSNKKVWWKCNKGHEWMATIASRTNGNGCPYCSGLYAIKGETDLATLNPKLVSEWNYDLNGGLKPFNVTSYSHQKVWWKCLKGHEWQAVINSRNSGSGCPICNSERHTSFPEYALVYYLKKYGVEVIHSYKAQGYELDIYIPSAKIAIEYDGGYWHKNRRGKEIEKNSKCKKDGIKLYRIREGLSSLNDSSIDYVIENNQEDLTKALEEILSRILGQNVDVNLTRDSISIENLRVCSEKEASLLLTNPILAGEWNYEKNGNLKPENVTPNSNKKVWWKCLKGHEWLTNINNRSNGRNCPYCSNKRLLRGYNDLSTRSPALAKEWNYKKNGGLTPADVMPNTNKTVWWKCNKGHEWAANINNRSQGNGCPYCSNQKVLSGYNDLTKTNTLLAREWNFSRNGSLKPEHCTASSGQKVWWKCSKGHEWQAIIASRNKGHGCPYCAGQKAIKGENDLLTLNPKLAREWDYQKNNGLTPMDVMPNSNKKVWWKCTKGHEWQAIICSRNNGRGCPECAKQKRMKNKNKEQ